MAVLIVSTYNDFERRARSGKPRRKIGSVISVELAVGGLAMVRWIVAMHGGPVARTLRNPKMIEQVSIYYDDDGSPHAAVDHGAGPAASAAMERAADELLSIRRRAAQPPGPVW